MIHNRFVRILLLSSFVFCLQLRAAQDIPKDASVILQTDEIPKRFLCLAVGLSEGQLLTTHSCASDVRSSQNAGIKVSASSLSGKDYGSVRLVADDLGIEKIVAVFLVTGVVFETILPNSYSETANQTESSLYSFDLVKKVKIANCSETDCQVNAFNEVNGSPIFRDDILQCIYSSNSGYCDIPNIKKLILNNGFSTPTSVRRKLLSLDPDNPNNFTCVCDCQSEHDSLAVQAWHRFTEAAELVANYLEAASITVALWVVYKELKQKRKKNAG